jgi:RNA polymerase sigma-70 factor (ECF subfamily)
MLTEAPATQTYQSTRPYLFSVAYRMTGSASDAEDLVQEAWVRYLDAGAPAVDSLRAYLTTIVSRLSLDYLKSARVKREQYTGPWLPEPALTSEAAPGPAETAEQRDSVSIAFLTLLELLTPEQRIVYVLREAFGLAYDDIGTHLDKPAATCRQIYRRAQQRLARKPRTHLGTTSAQSAAIDRFLAAIATGNAGAVARVLAPDVTWISDAGAQRLAARRFISGADRVSRGLVGLARKWLDLPGFTTGIEDVNGTPAIVFRYFGAVERVAILDLDGDRIASVRFLMNPDKLRHFAASLGTEVATLPRYRAAKQAASA